MMIYLFNVNNKITTNKKNYETITPKDAILPDEIKDKGMAIKAAIAKVFANAVQAKATNR